MPRAPRTKVRVTTPQHLVGYAPYGVGVECALVYFERGPDVYGWWIGARDAEWHSTYFKLEEFFTTRQTRFLASEGMDLYGGWKRLYSARETGLDKPEPVADEAAHELERIQVCSSPNGCSSRTTPPPMQSARPTKNSTFRLPT